MSVNKILSVKLEVSLQTVTGTAGATPTLLFPRSVLGRWGRSSPTGTTRERSGPPGHAQPHLEGLDEGPEQDSDGVALAEQLDEPGGTEEAEEAEVDEVVLQGKEVAL